MLELREVLTQHLHCAQLQGLLVLLVVLKKLVVWTQLEAELLLARALLLVQQRKVQFAFQVQVLVVGREAQKFVASGQGDGSMAS